MSSADELDPDALSEALLRYLAPQLTDDLRAQMPAFVALLMARFSGQVPPLEAPPPALAALSKALAGAEIPVGGALLSFGRDNHLGAVTIRDVVGRDQIHHTGNVFHIYGPVYLGGVATEPPTTALTPPPTPPEVLRREDKNPFVVGPVVPPEQLCGRRDQIMSIRDRIGGISPQCISIVGFPRSGRSSLLRYVRERRKEFCTDDQQPLIVALSLRDPRFHTPEGITEGLRRGIEQATGKTPWQADTNDPWAIDNGLQALRDSGRRLIVLLDHFEQIGARLEEFKHWGDDWREKASTHGYFALVIATVRPIDESYEKLGVASLFGNIFTTTELGALAPDEWHALVRAGFAPTAVSDADLALLDDLAGGLPFYTQLAAQLLWRHGDHTRTREAFVREAAHHFPALWRNLYPQEQHALKHAAGLPGLAAPANGLRSRLQRHGLLRADGRLFSSALAEWVREQR